MHFNICEHKNNNKRTVFFKYISHGKKAEEKIKKVNEVK
jgi:hypothetical protein